MQVTTRLKRGNLPTPRFHAWMHAWWGCLVGLALMGMAPHVSANQFDVGDSVLIAFPSPIIKEDAFLTGQITRITPQGRYQIAVRDYVVGHDYGLSCEPIAVSAPGQPTDASGWTLWEDTKRLNQSGLEYLVAADRAMKPSEGKHYFIDRNNLFTRFSRWKSDAPVMPIAFLNRAKKQAPALDLEAMAPAFEVAVMHRRSFYDPSTNAPRPPIQRLPWIEQMLTQLQTQLQNNEALRQHWFAQRRDWQTLKQSTFQYFLIEALDKAVSDAEGAWLDTEDATEKAKLRQSIKQKLDWFYQRQPA